MDPYSPTMMKAGMRAMIGKGPRTKEVNEAMKQYGCVYFGATGGAGALIAKSIKAAKIVAWEELGAEAIRELVVEDFPLIVVGDAESRSLYEEGKAKYERK
jgi:fumarate hydratase subunit beta